MPGEFEIIEWIRSKVASGNAGFVQLGIGDDCSVINQPNDKRKWLITTDMLLDGRHFQLQSGLHSPEQVGRKAMGVNISDIAAMAGTPVAAFVSVALPKSNTKEIAQLLTEGIKAEAEKFDIVLAGGDGCNPRRLHFCEWPAGRFVPFRQTYETDPKDQAGARFKIAAWR